MITVFVPMTLLTCAFLWAGPIPGVPNELRREFKSVHKFKESKIKFKNTFITSRLDLDEKRPVLFYGIPKSTSDSEILYALIGPQLEQGLHLKPDLTSDGSTKFKVFTDKIEIEGAWVKIQTTDSGAKAIGLMLPKDRQITLFKGPSKFDGLKLINGKIVQYKIKKHKGYKILFFPESSNIPSRKQIEIFATKAALGKSLRIPLPSGSFPDQIVEDKESNIWLTQPNNSRLTRYNPTSKEWSHITVGNGADGLILDKNQNLWFGEYFNQHLGFYDPAQKVHKQYKMPYENSKPAIPYESADGMIWLTDHSSNAVSVFNPITEVFEHIFKAPTENSWMVQLIQTENSDDVFVTQCKSNSIGQINRKANSFQEILLGVNTCPAFFTTVGDDLWITLWSQGSLIKLNTKYKSITEYQITFSEAGMTEKGTGPIGKDAKGNIYFGSLGTGKVYKLDPISMSLTYVDGVGGLKDGLTVTKDGTVWVTEVNGSLNKISFHP